VPGIKDHPYWREVYLHREPGLEGGHILLRVIGMERDPD